MLLIGERSAGCSRQVPDSDRPIFPPLLTPGASDSTGSLIRMITGRTPRFNTGPTPLTRRRVRFSVAAVHNDSADEGAAAPGNSTSPSRIGRAGLSHRNTVVSVGHVRTSCARCSTGVPWFSSSPGVAAGQQRGPLHSLFMTSCATQQTTPR
jgi:hypothetical protein